MVVGDSSVTDEALVHKVREPARAPAAHSALERNVDTKNGRLRRFSLLSPKLQDREIRHSREPENRNTVQALPAGSAGIHHRVSLQSLARCPSICFVCTEQASLK